MTLRLLLLLSLSLAGCNPASVQEKQQAPPPKQPKVEASPSQSTVTPQTIAKDMFPNGPEKTQNIDCFRALKPEVSIYAVVQKCGRPDEEVGSGIYIFLWHMSDGSLVSIGTPTLQRIGYIRHTDPSGGKSSFLNRK